jgi:hypothetical protein
MFYQLYSVQAFEAFNPGTKLIPHDLERGHLVMPDWAVICLREGLEYCARFPWSGGRHPWLDALAETPETIIGVESKRFEPYRDIKNEGVEQTTKTEHGQRVIDIDPDLC